MPLDGESFGTPQEWLRRARGNLARAKQSKPEEGFWEDLCFDAQQAAEKAVKAVLILRQTDFPKTHDIVDLLLLLQDSGQEITEEILEAGRLSRYAVETRYPGPAEPVSENEYRQALALAEKVVQWAAQVIAGGK